MITPLFEVESHGHGAMCIELDGNEVTAKPDPDHAGATGDLLLDSSIT